MYLYYSDKSYLRYISFTKSARAFPWNPFFDFFKKNIKRFSGYRFRGLQWFSSNKSTLQIFSNQPQTACYNGWLQHVL